MTRKAIHPVVSISLLLIVSIFSVISLQIWFSSYNSAIYADLNTEENVFSQTEIEDIYGDFMYLNTGGNSLEITKVEIEGINCNISGSYLGLAELNLSSCLEEVNSRVAVVKVFTDKTIISKSMYLKNNNLESQSLSNSNCYDSSFVNTIGTQEPCLGMLIVNRSMLTSAFVDGSDRYIPFEGTDYTFGDSLYNVFTGQITDMNRLFLGDLVFNADINYWDTSNVVNMSHMFAVKSLGNSNFNQPLNNWNVSQVEDFSNMFLNVFGDNYFNQDLSSWELTSASNMAGMFFGANYFNQDLSSWSFYMRNVVNLDNMFNSASAFNQNISSWCTNNFPVEPSNFDNGAAISGNPSFQPDWGNNDCV